MRLTFPDRFRKLVTAAQNCFLRKADVGSLERGQKGIRLRRACVLPDGSAEHFRELNFVHHAHTTQPSTAVR